jgi:hypothetical protein
MFHIFIFFNLLSRTQQHSVLDLHFLAPGLASSPCSLPASHSAATQPLYANTDIWADNLLNKSAHAAETRKATHTQFAQELTRIANDCGIPTTCNESRIPYRDEGQNHQSRKRADMMTLTGCGISPNLQLNLQSSTKLCVDVTISHTYSIVHDFKPNNLRIMETTKLCKYDYHYLRQRLAFAPMVANTLGQCGPDLLQFLWNLADHHTRLNLGFSIETTNNPVTCPRNKAWTTASSEDSSTMRIG